MPRNNLALAENPRAVAGDNQPPPSPFEIAEKAVNDVYDETVLWLDGHVIDGPELADGVGNLLTAIRAAEKLADDTRKTEKAPLDEAIREIQDRYAPLIADTKTVKGKTVLAETACKQALQPWLDAEDRRIRAEAQAAREEADRQQREAEDALRASDAANLAARAEAEELLSAAKKANTVATVAERLTAKAGGASGRSIALRTVYVPTLADPVLAARHFWAVAREDMTDCLMRLAERDVRLGKREIPGFTITATKVPV